MRPEIRTAHLWGKSTLLSDGALCFANDTRTRTRTRMLDHWQRRIKVHVI